MSAAPHIEKIEVDLLSNISWSTVSNAAERSSSRSMTHVEGLNVITVLNVITFGPKCNKALNVITFGPKCNKVLNVIAFSPKCNKPSMQRLTPSVHCCCNGHSQ